MIERKLNSGRSILEMLGVLAIIAVITLMGLGLIRFLINYAEAYSTIKSANETAMELRIRQGRGYMVENYWMFNANITMWEEQRVLTLAMRDTASEGLCKAILRQAERNTEQAERNTEIIHVDVEPANCTADNNQVVFYFAFDEGTYHSPFTGDANTDKNDPLSGVCAGKSIPNGACTYEDEDENCILRKDVGDSCGSGSVCRYKGTDLVCTKCPEKLPDGDCRAWDGCDGLVDKADGESCGENHQCQSGECVCTLECGVGQEKDEDNCRCVCPASTPKWDGTKCDVCPTSTPKWDETASACVACSSSTPYWNGTECVEDPCSVVDSTWTATEPDVSRTNYLGNALACEVGDEIGAFTLEQLQVGTTEDGTACYCGGGYYTYFEGGCASNAKSCRECPSGFEYGYVQGDEVEYYNDNEYSAPFSCGTGLWWHDEKGNGDSNNLVSCDAYEMSLHGNNYTYECQAKWDFCDLSGTPMMMGGYCFTCDYLYDYVEDGGPAPMSTADTDLVNATCGLSGENAYVYASTGGSGGTYSCSEVKGDIENYGSFNPGYAGSGVCKTVKYNDDNGCWGGECTECTSIYKSGDEDEYCQYVGNICGLDLQWSEDRWGCIPTCPASTPKWNGTECVECPASTPKWDGTECVACSDSECCSSVDGAWNYSNNICCTTNSSNEYCCDYAGNSTVISNYSTEGCCDYASGSWETDDQGNTACCSTSNDGRNLNGYYDAVCCAVANGTWISSPGICCSSNGDGTDPSGNYTQECCASATNGGGAWNYSNNICCTAESSNEYCCDYAGNSTIFNAPTEGCCDYASGSWKTDDQGNMACCSTDEDGTDPQGYQNQSCCSLVDGSWNFAYDFCCTAESSNEYCCDSYGNSTVFYYPTEGCCDYASGSWKTDDQGNTACCSTSNDGRTPSGSYDAVCCSAVEGSWYSSSNICCSTNEDGTDPIGTYTQECCYAANGSWYDPFCCTANSSNQYCCNSSGNSTVFNTPTEACCDYAQGSWYSENSACCSSYEDGTDPQGYQNQSCCSLVNGYWDSGKNFCCTAESSNEYCCDQGGYSSYLWAPSEACCSYASGVWSGTYNACCSTSNDGRNRYGSYDSDCCSAVGGEWHSGYSICCVEGNLNENCCDSSGNSTISYYPTEGCCDYASGSWETDDQGNTACCSTSNDGRNRYGSYDAVCCSAVEGSWSSSRSICCSSREDGTDLFGNYTQDCCDAVNGSWNDEICCSLDLDGTNVLGNPTQACCLATRDGTWVEDETICCSSMGKDMSTWDETETCCSAIGGYWDSDNSVCCTENGTDLYGNSSSGCCNAIGGYWDSDNSVCCNEYGTDLDGNSSSGCCNAIGGYWDSDNSVCCNEDGADFYGNSSSGCCSTIGGFWNDNTDSCETDKDYVCTTDYGLDLSGSEEICSNWGEYCEADVVWAEYYNSACYFKSTFCETRVPAHQSEEACLHWVEVCDATGEVVWYASEGFCYTRAVLCDPSLFICSGEEECAEWEEICG